jgi:hypothetical protein
MARGAGWFLFWAIVATVLANIQLEDTEYGTMEWVKGMIGILVGGFFVTNSLVLYLFGLHIKKSHSEDIK